MKLHKLTSTYEHQIEAIKDAATFAAVTIRSSRKKKAAILKDSRFSESHKAEQVNQTHDRAKADLERTFEQARDAVSEIREATNNALQPSYASVEAELLDEIRLGRAWDRYVRLLDSGKDAFDVIKAASNDPTGLRALRAELPAYLAATHDGNAGYIEAVQSEIDAAETPHLTDVQARAREIEAEMNKAEYFVGMAEVMAFQGLESDEAASLPTFNGAGVVHV